MDNSSLHGNHVGLLIEKFFSTAPTSADTIESATPKAIQCVMILEEMRTRAHKDRDIAGLRDVHTLKQELDMVMLSIRRSNEMLSSVAKKILLRK